MKRKKTPPSPVIVQRLQQARSREEVVSILSEVRYAGDIKQLAESYGLHYLKSKRMRTRELRQWIIDNHPSAKKLVAGVDWGKDGGTAVSVFETQPDGSLKIIDAEVTHERYAGPDRQGSKG